MAVLTALLATIAAVAVVWAAATRISANRATLYAALLAAGERAFAVDHGVIKNCEGYNTGDSPIYPGSASDVNSDKEEYSQKKRWAVEIFNCKSHHNALGYSGTAGNSVWAHHNDFYANATGIATDSLFPGHPGLPQDHARWDHNRIFSNNQNYYERYIDTGDMRPSR